MEVTRLKENAKVLDTSRQLTSTETSTMPETIVDHTEHVRSRMTRSVLAYVPLTRKPVKPQHVLPES